MREGLLRRGGVGEALGCTALLLKYTNESDYGGMKTRISDITLISVNRYFILAF